MKVEDLKAIRQQLVLEHAWGGELFAHLSHRLSATQQARLDAHLARCTVCQRRVEQLGRELDEVVRPGNSLWQEVAAATRRLSKPIRLAWDALGKLAAIDGPTPLAGTVVGATMDGNAQVGQRWHLGDSDANTAIYLDVIEATEGAGALDLRVRVITGQGDRSLPGRLDIVDVHGQSYLSGPLAKFEHLAARVPCGQWVLRLSVREARGAMTWEIPLSAVERKASNP